MFAADRKDYVMHATHTDPSRATPLAGMDGFDQSLAHAHIDDDWEEFLSLGLEGNAADLGQQGWQRAPVLLSY